ncbi:MAG: hypothetical protein D6808_04575, partial [Candidatus Dadabacteria bacterium]
IKPDTFVFDDIGVSVRCLPHLALGDLDPSLLRADDKIPYNILCVHAQVGERWRTDYGGVELPLKSLSPHEWDYIALGHVHMKRELSLNAAYSGSLEYTSTNIWAEASECKGFLEIRFPEGKRKFHQLTSPREVLNLEKIDASGLSPEEVINAMAERLEAVPGGIEGKIIRLLVENITRETSRSLNYAQIKRWRKAALNLTVEFRAPQDELQLSVNLSRQRKSIREEIVEFCKAKQLPDNEAVVGIINSYWENMERQEEQ